MPRTIRSWTVPVIVASALVLAAGAAGFGLARGLQAAPAAPVVPVSPTTTGASNGPGVFGSTVQLLPGEMWNAGIAREEAAVGPLGVVRVFQNEPIASILTPIGARSGIISFRETPASVLAGEYDAEFNAFFAAAPTDHPTYWSYYHEADVAYTHGSLTDLAQFRAAYTHVALLAAAVNNPQLRLAVILVGYTANPASGLTVSEFMPRSDLVDVVAWDNYDGWFTDQKMYGDPTNMIQMDQQAAATVGKPWAVAEFGALVFGGKNGGRAAWITNFSRTAASYGAQFVSYYDSNQYNKGPDYRLNDAPSRSTYHAVLLGQGTSVPDAPGSVIVTAGSGAASVTWQTPDDYDRAITGYGLTARDDTSGAVISQSAPAGATAATITGLTNGVSYTVSMTAINSLGASAASPPQGIVPGGALTVPGPPTVSGAWGSNAAATVSWTAPADNGGSSISGYTVTAIDTATGDPAGTTAASGDVGTAKVTGLVNGRSYVLSVVATNSVGDGAAARSAPVTPWTAPGVPSGVRAIGGDTSVTATWTAPNNNGAPITSYTLTAVYPQTGGAVATATVSGAATSGTVTGLTNGKSYAVTVTADNGATGPTSAQSNTVLSATTCAPPYTTAGGGVTTDSVVSATAFWRLTTANGGSAATGYVVTTYQMDGPTILSTTDSTVQPASARLLKVTGLIRKGTYRFSVSAINAAGPSATSPMSNLVNAY